jgi:uncharacterized delta-60 repeat protein
MMTTVPPQRGLRHRAAIIAAALMASTSGAAWAFPGDLDPTFGIGGIVDTPFGNQQAAQAIVVQPDGKLVAAGGRAGNGFSDFCLARYDADGGLDLGFGTGGKVTTDFDGNTDVANALLVQPDGKLVAVGVTVDPAGGGAERFGLARYLPDGSLDPAFGSGGKVRVPLGTIAAAQGAALQPDGKIVAVGYTNFFGSGSDFVIMRFDDHGVLDPSFGSGGIVEVDLGAGTFGNDEASAVVVQPDGAIVVGGSAERDADVEDFALARFTSSGDLDGSFGTAGVVYTDFLGTQDTLFGLALQPDGNIVGVGFTVRPGAPNWDLSMARYLPDGTLDVGFGTNGRVMTSFGTLDSGQAVTLQPDGKIVVAGTSDSNVILARYGTTGLLDPSFGSVGKVVTSFPGTPGAANALVREPDGSLVTAGSIGSFAASVDFGLVRYVDTAHTTSVVAATGIWTASVIGADISGTLTFDNAPFSVFGTAVNLGTSVGSVPYTGPLTSFNGSTGTVVMNATSPLAFHANGAFVCAASGCFSGDPVNTSAIATVTPGSGGLPGGVVYQLTGSLEFVAETGLFSGPFTLTAIAPANTTTGDGVVVSAAGITVTYDHVDTPGTTLVTFLGGTPGDLPPQFEVFSVNPASSSIVAAYFDVSTDAGRTGNITLCVQFSLDPLPPLFLQHYVGGTWVNVPLTSDTAHHQLCGTVTSLSPFALVVDRPNDDGFVPQDRTSAKCAGKLATAVAKLAGAIVKCHGKVARKAGFDENGCKAEAETKYDAATPKLIGCSPCALANAASLGTESASVLESVAGAAYCAGTTPLGPDDFALLPPDPTTAKCEDKFAASAAKLLAAVVKCHVRTAKAAVAEQAFDEGACEASAEAKYGATIAGLQGCPSCATANFTSVLAQVERMADHELNGAVYCAGTVTFP